MKSILIAALVLFSTSAQAWELNRIFRSYVTPISLKVNESRSVRGTKTRDFAYTNFQYINPKAIRIVTTFRTIETGGFVLDRTLEFTNDANTVVRVFVGGHQVGTGWCSMNVRIARRFCNLEYASMQVGGKTLIESEEIALSSDYSELSLLEWRNPQGYGFWTLGDAAYPRRRFGGHGKNSTTQTLSAHSMKAT